MVGEGSKWTRVRQANSPPVRIIKWLLTFVIVVFDCWSLEAVLEMSSGHSKPFVLEPSTEPIHQKHPSNPFAKSVNPNHPYSFLLAERKENTELNLPTDTRCTTLHHGWLDNGRFRDNTLAAEKFVVGSVLW
jgi:hypothetical protein